MLLFGSDCAAKTTLQHNKNLSYTSLTCVAEVFVVGLTVDNSNNIHCLCDKLQVMRVEPYQVGSVVHVVKRGARGGAIVFDNADRWRFTRTLYILNDEYQNNEWTRYSQSGIFTRPEHWPARDSLVSVLAWVLLDNHFHLLLQVNKDYGLSKFMQRLGGSMTTYANEKYAQTGSLFQGSYRSRTVDNDHYLQYLVLYIAVKNVLEMHPRGFQYAVENFAESWKWAQTYPFSSFQTLADSRQSPIIDMEACRALGLYNQDNFIAAKNMVESYNERQLLPPEILLEKW